MKRMNQGTLIASIGVLLMLVGVLVLSGGSKSLFGTAVGGNGQSNTQLTSGDGTGQDTQLTSGASTAQLLPSTQFPGVILLIVGLIVAATGMVMRRKPTPSMR